MNYDYKKIGNRIKEERKARGMTQEDFAATYHVKRSTVSKWEHGETMPNFQTMLDMCKEFDCELGYLLCENGYGNRTREATDICKATGLSEEAVKVLKDEIEHIEALNEMRIAITGEETPLLKKSELQKFISYFLANEDVMAVSARIARLKKDYDRHNELKKDNQYLELWEIYKAVEQVHSHYFEEGEVHEALNDLFEFLSKRTKCMTPKELEEFYLHFPSGIKLEKLSHLKEIALNRCNIDEEMNILAGSLRIKEREFLVWDSFMDIVKAYVKEGAEDGRKDKLQEER